MTDITYAATRSSDNSLFVMDIVITKMCRILNTSSA